jgi:YidC/Oxa1 family membrane protein insertase
MFEIPAALLSLFYGFIASYTIAIGLVAVVVVVITTPLALASTRGTLGMQRLEPEKRRLQNEYRDDHVRLSEQTRNLYREHKVRPAAPFLPPLVHAAVFVIMFRVLRGLTYKPHGSARPIANTVWAAFGRPDQVADPGFIPRYLAFDSALYKALFSEREMMSLGLDLSKSAATEIANGMLAAWPYILLVVLLGALYFALQRTVATRAVISPTVSKGQQKGLRYLPVILAAFQIFFLAALVVYYLVQTLARIVQQTYVTRSLSSQT